jgi:hypothetical protein
LLTSFSTGVSAIARRPRGPWQIAFGLSDSTFFHQIVNVVRHNLQNQVQLTDCFRETSQRDIELGVSSKQIRIARVEPLGFVEVGFTLLPLPPIACDKGERLTN